MHPFQDCDILQLAFVQHEKALAQQILESLANLCTETTHLEFGAHRKRGAP